MKLSYAEIALRGTVWPTALENVFIQKDYQDYAFKNMSFQQTEATCLFMLCQTEDTCKSPSPKMRDTKKSQIFGSGADTAVTSMRKALGATGWPLCHNSGTQA